MTETTTVNDGPDVIDTTIVPAEPFDTIADSVADWGNAIPFTKHHETMLTEVHAGLLQIAALIEQVPEMMKNSPLASMFGLTE